MKDWSHRYMRCEIGNRRGTGMFARIIIRFQNEKENPYEELLAGKAAGFHGALMTGTPVPYKDAVAEGFVDKFWVGLLLDMRH